MKHSKTLLVIGGGAAGFFTAINAACFNPRLRVILAEKSSKLLSKVKVSGGGRCNVTHACFNVSELIKFYPRGASFLKSAFHEFNPLHTVEWFSERNVKLKTESDGRMFPETDNSQTIIDCLLDEVNRNKIEILMNADVQSLEPVPDSDGNNRFIIHFRNRAAIDADFVCVACGGFPKTEQFDWIRKTGHSIVNPLPSLFTFNMPGNKLNKLMGISVKDVMVKIPGTKLQQRGPVLITHWGLSGPAVLKLSAYGAREISDMNYAFNVLVNWLPELNENALIEKMKSLRFEIASQKIYNRNPFNLPARFWEYCLQLCGINEEIRWADLPVKEQNKLSKMLCAQVLEVKGKTTFKEEFVTAGGVSLSEIDHKTMGSKILKGLYFAGEIIDADGVTGGFNFQNAWTTGWIAAKAIAGFS